MCFYQLRRVQGPTQESNPIKQDAVAPPPAPIGRSMTPGHHLAVSRPLWDPEFIVKPRAVVPDHLRASSVLRVGEERREEHRGRRMSLSQTSYNPITHLPM